MSFLPANTAENNEYVRRAQRILLAEMFDMFHGPDTDALGIEFRYDNVHFNGPGLHEHALLWKETLLRRFGDSMRRASSPHSVPAFYLASTENATAEQGDFVTGYRFRVDGPVEVTALGFFDEDGDGLLSSHQVGIWEVESDYAPVVAATVPAGDAAALEHGFRYVPVTTTTLAAGSYVVGASTFSGGDRYLNGPEISAAIGVYFEERAYALGSELRMPDRFRAADPAFFGPNLKCVLPDAFELASPTSPSIFQRHAAAQGAARVAGRFVSARPVTRLVARHREAHADAVQGPWRDLPFMGGRLEAGRRCRRAVLTRSTCAC